MCAIRWCACGMGGSRRSRAVEMTRLKLFFRLMVRPLFHEPARLALTVLAVALGVAVVLAIDMAGYAAAGSFRSSMETLAGEDNLEIVASGGVPESAVGILSSQPFIARVSPRIEDYVVVLGTKQTLPFVGLDLIAEGSRYAPRTSISSDAASSRLSSDSVLRMGDPSSVWVGSSLKKNQGDPIELLINDQTFLCTVQGVYPDSNGNESAVLMDISAAQRALNRGGRVDRILLKLPERADLDAAQKRLRELLPAGLEIRPQGTSTNENRKMLAAFRWNLRLLSYVALIVGAFLIFNTISISVVRRRPEIGLLRALGARRADIAGAFLGEAACLGLAGALLGLLLGRLMATGAAQLMALTVESLYVSSRPGPIELTSGSVVLALVVGMGIALASALLPAREAMQVSPVDAMARGRREYTASMHKERDLLIAATLAILAGLAAKMPAISERPLFGYLATILLIVASAYAIPAFAHSVSALSSATLGKWMGVEALLASRSLAASLQRTSVLVGALATAVAMMTSVGIMVGSFRKTVVTWMDDQLPADLYVRPAGSPAADRHPTLSVKLVEKIAGLPGVAAVQRLRVYEIRCDGMPAMLASVEPRVLRGYRKSDFLSERRSEDVLAELRGSNSVLVSEPFMYKHGVKRGDSITLPLGESRASFKIVDVYYDYGNERGTILMDRDTLLRYLPDPAPSNLAVFVAPHFEPEAIRRKIQEISAGSSILIFSDRDLRSEAIRIFDRTFAITYALEAVAVMVAVMGIAGALLALILDRRRELGLLRFLGASSRQVRKLILMEAGLLGLLANFAGFVLGYLLSLILVFVINKQSFGWTIRFHWPVAVLLIALSVVYVATVVSGLYPAYVAVRLNPIEAVHEE